MKTRKERPVSALSCSFPRHAVEAASVSDTFAKGRKTIYERARLLKSRSQRHLLAMNRRRPRAMRKLVKATGLRCPGF